MSQPALLADRAVIAVSGPDAGSFLQGLVTNDIERLGESGGMYAALLTPQGKILFDFLILRRDGTYWIDCAQSSSDALMRRLSLYRLRAKVKIEPAPDAAILASWNGASLPGVPYADPRFSPLGLRTVAPRNSVPPESCSPDTWLAHRLACGVPEGADFGQDRVFALDAGLEELNGVSFTKGCYVGQELTARMKHRATARKRLLPISAADGSSRLEEGSSVSAAGSDMGTVMSSYGTNGFALIRLDRLAEAATTAIEAGGVAARVTKPAWLSA